VLHQIAFQLANHIASGSFSFFSFTNLAFKGAKNIMTIFLAIQGAKRANKKVTSQAH